MFGKGVYFADVGHRYHCHIISIADPIISLDDVEGLSLACVVVRLSLIASPPVRKLLSLIVSPSSNSAHQPI